MVLFIEMPGVNLMFNPSFSPAQWMWSKFPVDGLQQLFDREKVGRRFLYEHHLHPWLTDIICEVAHEQVMASSGEFTDPVDKNVEENCHKENFKTCPNYGDRNMPRHNRLCGACNTTISAAHFKAAEQLQKTVDEAKKHQPSEVCVHIHKHDDAHYSVSYENQEEDLQSPYAHLGNHHAKDPTEIHMGEPIFINPCSFDALAVILRYMQAWGAE